MKISGKNFIGNNLSGKGNSFFAVNPTLNEKIAPEFFEATNEEINEAVLKAAEAFQVYRNKTGEEKALFLETIAEEILTIGDDLIKRCIEETALPEARLVGERARTVNQLKLFASHLREGSWVDARIDKANPERQPLTKPDVRSMKRALGPVGIFGASNFPLAFSVAGGDTASALAAGCTLVVKAHPAHPGTSELIAHAILNAVKKCEMPEGTFNMVHGASIEIGQAIVSHPNISAIGFTGSFKAGKALFDAANKRPIPIPVYAEMGSTNPVFILRNALKEHKDIIAKDLAASVTLGVGQFCTNPGLIIAEESNELKSFEKTLAKNINNVKTGTMLTAGIQQNYLQGIQKLKATTSVSLLSADKNVTNKASSYAFKTDSNSFMNDPFLEEEVFGPSTLLIAANSKLEMINIAKKLGGHLTATLHATPEDLLECSDLIAILEQKVGRLIINGYPTGVEVCHAMVHGGPFPSTTDSKTTSVGTLAINRFSRSVCYQGFPQSLLPDELKDNNPLKIWRTIDGELTKESI